MLLQAICYKILDAYRQTKYDWIMIDDNRLIPLGRKGRIRKYRGASCQLPLPIDWCELMEVSHGDAVRFYRDMQDRLVIELIQDRPENQS